MGVKSGKIHKIMRVIVTSYPNPAKFNHKKSQITRKYPLKPRKIQFTRSSKLLFRDRYSNLGRASGADLHTAVKTLQKESRNIVMSTLADVQVYATVCDYRPRLRIPLPRSSSGASEFVVCHPNIGNVVRRVGVTRIYPTLLPCKPRCRL